MIERAVADDELLRLLSALCDDAERLAPLTGDTADGTEAALNASADRLRGHLHEAQRDAEGHLGTARTAAVERDVDAIIEATGAWLEMRRPTDDAAAVGARILETGKLLRSLRARAANASASSHRVATRPRVVVADVEDRARANARQRRS